MFARRLPPLALSLTVLIQIGCGSPPSSEADTATSAEAGAPAATAGTVPPTAAPDVVATRPSSVAGVEVDLLGLSRSGDAVTVRWQYRTAVAEGVPIAAGDDPYALTREAYLFDDANQKKYMVVEDDAGRPVAAEHAHDAGVVVTLETPIVAWAKFPAPPEGIDRLSFHLPGVEPIENIAIGQ